MRFKSVLVSTVCVLPLITGCQTDSREAVSLEQAKQVTAKFEGQSFTPPPRTLEDITAILDQQKRSNPEAVTQAKRRANQKPPKTANKNDLARFYWERGQAAGKIGREKQQISDFNMAIEISGGSHWGAMYDLSVVYSLFGDYNLAIPLRERAIKLISIEGKRIGRLAILSGLQARGGDLESAERSVSQANGILSEARDWNSWNRLGNFWMARIERANAQISSFKGRYLEADNFYRTALQYSEKAINDNPGHKYNGIFLDVVRSDFAVNMARQGRLVEAEVEVRKALRASLARSGRNSTETVRTILPFAEIIAAQGRDEDAEILGRTVVDILTSLGATSTSLGLNRARWFIGETLTQQGSLKKAAAEFDTVKANLAGDPELFEKNFGGSFSWAVAMLGTGRAAEANAAADFSVVRNLGRLGKKHYNTALALGLQGMTRASLGRKQEALKAFGQAVPILLTRSRQSDSGTASQASKSRRLNLILEAYIKLFNDIIGTPLDTKGDAAEQAFRIADIARSRSVLGALAASGARAAAGNAKMATLIRDEQDIRKQVSALFGLLANAVSIPRDKQNRVAVKSLRARITTLRKTRTALAEEIEEKFPEYANLVNPKPATVASVQKSMRMGDAMVATYVTQDRTYVWAIPKSGKVRFTSTPIGAENIIDIVGELREALDPQAETLGNIPAFNVALSHKLYKSLLEPIRDAWKDARNLLVVGHRGLAQLPFSVLVTKPYTLDKTKEGDALFSNHRGVPWLANSYAVTVLPAATALASLRAVPISKKKRRAFAGFGDPYFSVEQAAKAESGGATQVASATVRGVFKARSRPVRLRSAPKTRGINSADLAMLPRLPDTADEVTSIAKALKANFKRDVYLGKRATEDSVKGAKLSDYKVLAFATHGLVPGDLNGLVQPALALSSPALGGTKGDGLLTMGEILGLRLDADWVVLSACNTAAAEGEGAEAFSGLGRAFFYAGTRAMLLSNWPVETTSARLLTTDLFRRQAKDPTLNRTRALQQSMQTLMNGPGYVDPKTKKVVFSYAHPIFWAPFSLVGDGGGGKPAS